MSHRRRLPDCLLDKGFLYALARVIATYLAFSSTASGVADEQAWCSHSPGRFN